MMATRDEIEKLKESWLNDPCWDIEDTEGFEEHREELLAYHDQMRVQWKAAADKRRAERIKKVEEATGVGGDVAEALCTFSEIEDDVIMATRATDSDLYGASTVRALLLVAAQLKRIADFCERNDGSDGILCQIRDGRF